RGKPWSGTPTSLGASHADARRAQDQPSNRIRFPFIGSRRHRATAAHLDPGGPSIQTVAEAAIAFRIHYYSFDAPALISLGYSRGKTCTYPRTGHPGSCRGSD